MNHRIVHGAVAGIFAAALGLGSPASAQPARSGAVAQAKKPDAKKKPAKDKDKDKKKAAKPAAKPSGHHAAAPVGVPAAAPVVPAGPAATPLKMALSIEKAKLDNGLRVVMNVDRTSPTVAVAVTYDVGSRNEQRGRSGFAHLFEHMMFQGSGNVPKGDHFKLVASHGGVLNGTTSSDRTNYFEVLPANELALALWLEADRMKSLAVNAENFENQRKVVQDEYRMRVSNVAYVPSELRLEEMVFQGYWPYEYSTIGSMADLDGAKLEWVQEFFAKHYAPNNAVITIAGDFEPAEAMALVKKYFDSAKRADTAPFEDVPFPEQTSQRTAVMKDAFARTPGILYGWAVPPHRSPDHYALEMASVLLGHGESSRLHQLLVRDKGVALEVSAATENRRGPDLFVIDLKLSGSAKVGDVEKLVEAEIKSLATRGPTDAEMEKARRRAQAGLVLGLQSNMSRATRLGEYEVFYGDARLVNAELDHYFAVTKDDLKRVVMQHLGPTRRTIVETYPADAQPAAPPKPAPAVASTGDGGAKKPGKPEAGAKHDAKKAVASKGDKKEPKKEAKKTEAKKKKN